MHYGGDRRNGSESPDSVGLTSTAAVGSIDTRSPYRKEISVASKVLAPLRQGKPVVLEVDDPRLPKRRRIEKPLMFLTPQSVFGAPSTLLVVSLQSHGCEVIDTSAEVKPIAFIRLGLGARLAVALARELDLVFKKGEPHGSKT